jgi:hypothetical protein
MVDMNRREFGKDVRNRALQIAKYRCERCGERDNLQLHHIGGHYDNSLFNCLVMCEPCHIKHHKAEWRRNFFR